MSGKSKIPSVLNNSMTLLVKNQPTNSLHCQPVKQLGQKENKTKEAKGVQNFFYLIFPLETAPGYLINTIKMWSITQVKLSMFEACIL